MSSKLSKNDIVKVFNNQLKQYLSDIKLHYKNNITVISSIETFLLKYMKSDTNRIAINLIIDKILIDDELTGYIKDKNISEILEYSKDNDEIANNKFFMLFLPIFQESDKEYKESLIIKLNKLIKLSEKFDKASE